MLHTYALRQKKDENGKTIDFDKIYNDFIKPAIEDAGLEPIRADEEQTGGIIYKSIHEGAILNLQKLDRMINIRSILK